MANLLSDYGQVLNFPSVMSELKKRVPELGTLKTQNFILAVNKSVKKGIEKHLVRYFSGEYLELEEEEHGCFAMWYPTDYLTKDGDIIYIQFTGGSPWTGALVGTESEILEYQKTHVRKRMPVEKRLEEELGVCVKDIEGVTVSTDEDKVGIYSRVSKSDIFVQNLHKRLLIPNSWTDENLANYVYLIICRLNNMLKSGDASVDFYMKVNESKSSVLINSGLLDLFGKYIYLIVRVRRSSLNGGAIEELSFNDVEISLGKAYAMQKGFTKMDVSLALDRVSFASDKELMFDGSWFDFDLSDWERLSHCIIERKDRFPEEYQNMSSDVLFSDMSRAIEVAVELNKYDKNYIKPIYSVRYDRIHFVIPYHVGGDFQKKPQLGIVVSNYNGFWNVMTVLGIEEVMRDIKLFSMYENESFD